MIRTRAVHGSIRVGFGVTRHPIRTGRIEKFGARIRSNEWSDWVVSGEIWPGWGSGGVKKMNFSVIFCRVEQVSAVELGD